MTFPAPNQMFMERYRLDAVLGEGGFATVFRATDVGSERVVAIKILKRESGGYAADIASRFTREVRVIAQLRDPHTVTLHDHGQTPDGLLFMVFEYVPGRDLNKVLAAERQLAPSIVIHIMQQVLQSLAEAHSKGLLHRDIKPENLRIFEYMGDPYHVKVLDFGIARPAEQARTAAITQAGELIGTPRYMSPEQLVERTLTPSTDIYSLGLVSLEMLTGASSLQGNRWSDQIDRLVTGHVFSIDEHERVGPGLRAIVQRMTAREPEDRYASAEAVIWALKSLTQQDSYDGPHPASNTGQRPQPADMSPTMYERRPRGLTPPPQTVGGSRLAARERTEVPWLALSVILVLIVAAAGTAAWLSSAQDDKDARSDRKRALISMQQRQRAMAAQRTDVGKPSSTVEDVAIVEDVAPVEAAPVGEGTEGCGAMPPKMTVSDHTISWMDGLNQFSVTGHLPKGYNPSQAYPVVMLFHQDGRTGDFLLTQTRFAELAHEHQFIVISPTYPGNVFANLAAWRKPSDVDFVHNLLRSVGRGLCVDPNRVYAVGHGAGGNVVERLACVRWIAGVATNGYRSEEPVFFDCDQPKPSLHLAPMNTKRLPLEGGSPQCSITGVRISLKANEEKWQKLNGCDASRTRKLRHDNGECFEYEGCEEPFVTCHLDGGYGWPGSSVIEHDIGGDCGDVVKDFPATDTIWGFFDGLAG